MSLVNKLLTNDLLRQFPLTSRSHFYKFYKRNLPYRVIFLLFSFSSLPPEQTNIVATLVPLPAIATECFTSQGNV